VTIDEDKKLKQYGTDDSTKLIK